MSTGRQHRPSLSLLEHSKAEVRPQFGLVCFNPKRKTLKTPVKTKAGVPHKHDTNKHKEHNGLGTGKMSVSLSEKKKKKKNIRRMTGKSRLSFFTVPFWFCSL